MKKDYGTNVTPLSETVYVSLQTQDTMGLPEGERQKIYLKK